MKTSQLSAGWFVFAACVIALAVIGVADLEYRRERLRFMTDCIDYRPEYVCIAMWRDGDKYDNVFVR